VSRSVPFHKLHSCGNDFLVVDHDPARTDDQTRALAIQLCERHRGPGADGVEFLSPDGAIRLLNADGSVAEISGNGTRCVAAYLAHKRTLRIGEQLTLRTDAGPRVCTLVAQPSATTWLFRATMGVPTVAHRSVSLGNGLVVSGAVVRTGNPHFVLFCPDESFTVEGLAWQAVGQQICFHPDFAPEQTNVEFVHIRAHNEIAIRIFERGVGPTSSSGTGTSASAAAAIAYRHTARSLTVHAPGGAQAVDWPAAEEELLLTGPATLVAEGVAYTDAGTPWR
jgi:diaminopimelate epimerase